MRVFTDITSIGLGPTNMISDYDGGCNFAYFGSLSKDVRASWPLPTETRSGCVFTSTARLAELVAGPFRTNCFVRGLVWAVDARKWEQVQWIVSRLPDGYALHSDRLTEAILATGVVSAIDYAISEKTKVARPIFRIAATNAVFKGHRGAAEYLCTRFSDSRLRRDVAIAAALEGDTHLVKWCAGTMRVFPSEATRALVYRGNLRLLEWLRSTGNDCFASDQLVLYACLGGHIPAVNWVLDSLRPRYRAEEVCLMVCAKGMLEVLKHLIDKRGFAFDGRGCLRFAKKGSGVAAWLTRKLETQG